MILIEDTLHCGGNRPPSLGLEPSYNLDIAFSMRPEPLSPPGRAIPRQPNIVIGTINNLWQYSFSKIPLFERENENSLIFSHFAWPKTHGKYYSNALLHKKLAQSHPKIPFSQTICPPTAIKGNTGSLERRGWSFIGWARTQEATAAKYRAGATLKITENLTLYAVWRSEGYTISFDKNHAGARAAQASQRAVFGTSVPLPATTTFIRPPEMKFEGWAESSTGAKIQGTYNPRNYWDTITLYAKWVRKIIAGNKNWTSIAMSDDGQYLAAVAYNGHIYTYSDSEATWTNRSTAAGSVSVIGGTKSWFSIAMSDDGEKLAAVVRGGHLYTAMKSGTTWTWTDRSTQEAP